MWLLVFMKVRRMKRHSKQASTKKGIRMLLCKIRLKRICKVTVKYVSENFTFLNDRINYHNNIHSYSMWTLNKIQTVIYISQQACKMQSIIVSLYKRWNWAPERWLSWPQWRETFITLFRTLSSQILKSSRRKFEAFLWSNNV